MTHLSPDTFIDIVDGTVDESSVPQLASCATCRAQLADLRAAWQAAAEAQMPEPSPLFWDHLSARIHEAVEAEPAPRAWSGASRWRASNVASGFSRTFNSRWRLAGVVSAAVAAVALIVVLDAPRHSGPAVDSGTVATQASTSDAGGAPAIEPLADDDSLGFVADLAGNIDWDETSGLGLAAHGDADVAVAGLTDDERVELQRLLHEALGQDNLL